MTIQNGIYLTPALSIPQPVLLLQRLVVCAIMEGMKAEESSTGNEPAPASLAAVLNRLRVNAGLTKYQLANRSGVSRGQLSRMESGEARHPAPETLQRIARALEVEPEEFYDAAWHDNDAPLPSPAVYFRSKYRLTDAQVAELEANIRRITEPE